MDVVQQGYKGLGLLVDLNFDRLLYIGTILGALMLGAFVGSLGV
ncbi:MAG: hypothetical protein AAFN59_12325 [Pseudomonadota bacterium]